VIDNFCSHVELYPRRNPGALPVCVECGTAVLDFDVVYRFNRKGNLTIDDDATAALAEED
jgi:hypothetical protein